jgi:glycosyltransferase involved in cell wall biosynthesis
MHLVMFSLSAETMKRHIKVCIIGNPDSIHVQRWARHFSGRAFDISVLTYYQPRAAQRGQGTISELGSNTRVHFVRTRTSAPSGGGKRSAAAISRFPGLRRLIAAARLSAAGFYRELNSINPDVVHAHYVSDYGFLAALSGRHPIVMTAWGSDLLVDPGLSMITRRLVKWALARADLVTYNSHQLGQAARAMGAHKERMLEVVLGVGPEMLEALRTRLVPPEDRVPMILSQRSLERNLYNVDVTIKAMPAVIRAVPAARLIVGGEGALRGGLEVLARELGVAHAVEFAGLATWPEGLADRLGKAAVYVSVPSSESTSVTLLEAMAAGAYPIVSDLPANREWVSPDTGSVVPVRQVPPLADAIVSALEDPDRRMSAAKRNRRLIDERGLWDVNMALMEKAYRDLAGVNGDCAEE